MELLFPASSSTSPSCSLPCGRAIDRHNPIITDEKRRGGASAPGTPCSRFHPIKPQTPLHEQQQSSKRSRKFLGGRKTKDVQKQTTNDDDHHDDRDDRDCGDGDDERRKSGSEPSDLVIMKAVACRSTVDTVNMERKEYLISPPESSRYLLSEFDPDLNSVLDNNKKKEAEVDVGNNLETDPPVKDSNPPLPGSSSGSSDQVVVLRVSLHCRGCERKMKKHLSRMAGVTSFNIDFAAKKVTVVGDVTPLQVLASISKVKNAQLMATPMSTNSKTMEAWK